MNQVRFTWHGPRVLKAINTKEQKALWQAGNEILAKSRELVPHDTGTLEGDSGVVVDPRDLVCTIYYGAEHAASYAVRQHQDLTLRHPNGREAKYLQKAVDRNMARVRAWLDKTLRF